ncbi:hypothetical protein JW935_22885 [candidate division KSB1 bacterium]|nr:hypothetical protein [candidate division KSB1 bacterium]
MKFQNQVIEWLLEENNPPVQYLTLTRLLKKPVLDPDVQRSRARLMEYEVTQRILEHGEKFWNDDDRAYWKYTGKFWQVIFLGQFLADGTDSRIADGISHILERRTWVMKSGGQCLTANLLAAFMRLGYGDHPVVIQETEKLAQRIVKDRGIVCSAMEYSLLPNCFMALPKLLLCFEEIPQEARSESVEAAIDLIVQILLAHKVYIYVPGTRKLWQQVLALQPKRADLPAGQTVKEWIAKQRKKFLASHGLGTPNPKIGWLKFGFPLHYNSDILEAMYALSRLGIMLNHEMLDSLQVIQQKKTSEGVWLLENSLNGKMWVDVEQKDRPSKWVTFFALFVLNCYIE